MGRVAFTKKAEPVDGSEIESRGRVFFTPKSEPVKVEPGIDWSEIESRLREIAVIVRGNSVDQSEPIVRDPPVTTPSDAAVTLSPYQDAFSEFQAAETSASMPSQPAGALNRVRANCN